MIRLIIASVVILILVTWFMIISTRKQKERAAKMENNIEQVEMSMDSSGN
ncbi:MAG: hypothetical protein OEX02_00755 [Cyclobacteriaceae bacterium]|nr:hypothetical protein [Cyclobacteriaceae bacterium]